jgi:NitT/TauT family transport system permease protein
MSRRFDSLWFALAVLAVWELFHLIAGEDAVASPWQTVHRAATLMISGSFWDNVAATFEAFGWATLIALGAGLVIGLILGMSRLASDVAMPIFNALNSIPKITLYPVILLMFGLGLPAKVAFGAIHGIFPVIILTMNGVGSIKPVIRKTARSLRLSHFETMRTILLPAALPEIFSGMRIGFALALLGTLIGELFASSRGLGFMLMRSTENHDAPTAMALVMLLFLVAAVIGAALLEFDRRLHHAR